MSTILSFFPSGLTPRAGQVEVLLKLEAEWQRSDVFCLVLPTAFGKSACALTIAKWAGQAQIIVPNNLLLQQYADCRSGIPLGKRREDYWCATSKRSCEAQHKAVKQCCADVCPYTKALQSYTKSPLGISNYYTYLAHKPYRSTLIIDEVQCALELLKELARKKLWQAEYRYPADARSFGDLIGWLEKLTAGSRTLDTKLAKLQKALLALEPSTLVRRSTQAWRGEPRDVLELLPLDVRNEPPVLWPPHRVRRLVLMSATLARPDLEAMGLAGRRVCWIEGASPIPAERRAVLYQPVGNMSFAHQDATLPKVAEALVALASSNPGKGLVHTPYAVAEKLRQYLGGNPRFQWHSRQDKKACYEAWQASSPEQGRVLVGSGLYEGIDLAYDLARWQAICKVPYLSLADPAIRWLAENKPETYAWQAVKALMQATGRVCRTPEDEGKTFILDSSFGTLYSRNSGLFSSWWRDAYQEGSKK